MNRFIAIGSIITFGIAAAACNNASPPAEVNSDVAKAEAARSTNVAEARSDGAQAIRDEQQDVTAEQRDVRDAAATRDFETALAKAEGDYEIATESCNALAGSSQADCKDQAAAVLESDKARAELLKPIG